MIKVYEAENVSDAYILASLLESENVEVKVCNDKLMNLVGELPYSGEILPIVVIMNESDLAKAQKIVNSFLKKKAKSQDEVWVCPNCQEENPESFEFCWNCKRLRR